MPRSALPRTVLVVDDDDDVRDTVVDALTFEGFAVAAVENGRDALDWLRRRLPGRPLVILLDLMMPVMDGRAFLRAKGEDPRLADVPTIVLTAGGDTRELQSTLPVNRCLSKAISISGLVAAINAVG